MPFPSRSNAAVTSRPARRIRGSSTTPPPAEPPPVSVVPDAPVLQGAPGDTQAIVSWTEPYHGGSPILSYELQRDAVTIQNVLSPRSRTDTGRTNGVIYTYRVRAVNAVGNSAWSNAVNVTPVAPPPTPVAPDAPILSGSAGDTQNILAWSTPFNGNSAITSYELERDTVNIFTGLSTGRTDSPLTNFVQYSYRVRAVNAIGPSAWSNTLLLTPIDPVQAPTAPDAPLLSGTPGNAQNTLTWTVPFDGNSPITSYELQRNSVTVQNVLSPRSFTDTGRTNGVSYAYRVRAINAIGAGPYSTVLNLTPVAPVSVPDPPVLSGSAGNNSASLSWTQPFSGGAAITTYELYRGFSLVQNLLSPRSFSESGLPNDIEQTYWVRAINSAGPSGASNLVKITPAAPGGSPTLPASVTVGRAASDFGFWGGFEVGLYPTPAEVAGWQTNIGFNLIYARMNGSGYVHMYGGGQRLRAGSTLVSPYTADTSYDWQRAYETTGPFQAKENGAPIKVGFFVKIHKPRDNTYTSPGVGGDIGPFGGDWWDDTHWADVCAKFKTFVQGAKWLGATHYNLDPEFGTWDYPPTGGRTLAEQLTKIEQRGFEFGKAWMEADPDAQMSHYGMQMAGSFHEEVVYKNGSTSDGAYFHPPTSTVDASDFEGEYPPTPISGSHGYHQDQGYQGVQHHYFYRGFWRAMAIYASELATWTYQDAFWYHASTQYSGLPSQPTTLEYAMRWGLWGQMSHLSRDPLLSTTTKNWLLRHYKWASVSWVSTDHNNGYFNSQLDEPAFSNLCKAGRVWGMGSHIEYGNGMPTPSSFAGNNTSTAGPITNESRGRPLGRSYGYNLYTGAKVPSGSTSTGVLGTGAAAKNADGQPHAGETMTYGKDASIAVTPVDYTFRYPVPTSRMTGLKAACSTAPIPSSPPTITLLAASVSNGNVTVTCRVTHPHAPWHVTVHRGSTFNAADTNASMIGVMAMTFQPNNGTNLPPAGLANPYMTCTFTSTGGGYVVGNWIVVGAYSTKEDSAWAKVQVT